MQVQDWLDAGYKRFENTGHIKQYADFGLQKCVRDEKGKRYYITVFVYDMTKYHQDYFSFVPDVQFRDFDGKHTVSMEMHTRKETTVQEVEDFFDKMWKAVGMPYYEEYN